MLVGKIFIYANAKSAQKSGLIIVLTHRGLKIDKVIKIGFVDKLDNKTKMYKFKHHMAQRVSAGRT